MTIHSLLLLLSICHATHAWSLPILSTTSVNKPVKNLSEQSSVSSPSILAEEQARARHNNDVFNALFAHAEEHITATPLVNIASPLPPDFPPGCLLRMGPNGASVDEAFLDGDGMIHSISFPPASTTSSSTTRSPQYSCFYVNTAGRQLEAATGKRFLGTLGAAPEGWGLMSALVKNMIAFRSIQALKDSCNTALAQHGSTVLALMEQGLPTQIQIKQDSTIETIQAKTTLNGAIPSNDILSGGQLSAHGRTCPKTGERIHVSYCSSNAPYARADIFQMDDQMQGWSLKRSIPIDDMQVPVMIHDSAITENYVVVMDFPLTVRPQRMIKNEFPVEYEPDHGAKIGLAHRFDENKPVQWFDVEPCVVLHAMNAYEDAQGKVILHGLRSVPRSDESYLSQYATAFLYEWSMDIKSGKVEEKVLNDETLVEFPVIDERWTGLEAKEGFAVNVASIGGPLLANKNPRVGITLDGIVKLALSGDRKGQVMDQYTFPAGWYGVSEPTVVPKTKSDGCYVLLIATQVPDDGSEMKRSRVFLLDGDNLSKPVWEADTPFPIPYGLHSSYVPWESLAE